MGSFVFHQEAKYRHFEIIVIEHMQADQGKASEPWRKRQTPVAKASRPREIYCARCRDFVMEEKINRRPL